MIHPTSENDGRRRERRTVLLVGLGMTVLLAAIGGVLVAISVAPWFVPWFILIIGAGASVGSANRTGRQ